MGNNPLGCYCQLIEEINSIKSAVQSGECEYPSAADGITLGISTASLTTYYATNASLYQCSKYIFITSLSADFIVWDCILQKQICIK